MIALILRIVVGFACLAGLGLLSKQFEDPGTDSKESNVPALSAGNHRRTGLPQATFPVLLAGHEIREELRLDNTQNAQVDECLSEMVRKLVFERPYLFPDDFVGGSAEEVMSRSATNVDFVHAIWETAQEELAGILHSEQLVRLRQLRLQRLGTMAFQEKEILSQLQLTRNQRERIGDLSRFGLAPGVDAAVQARCRAQMEEILSKQQWQQWQALIGEAYCFPDPATGKNPLEQRCLHLLVGLEPQSQRFLSPPGGQEIF